MSDIDIVLNDPIILSYFEDYLETEGGLQDFLVYMAIKEIEVTLLQGIIQKNSVKKEEKLFYGESVKKECEKLFYGFIFCKNLSVKMINNSSDLENPFLLNAYINALYQNLVLLYMKFIKTDHLNAKEVRKMISSRKKKDLYSKLSNLFVTKKEPPKGLIDFACQHPIASTWFEVFAKKEFASENFYAYKLLSTPNLDSDDVAMKKLREEICQRFLYGDKSPEELNISKKTYFPEILKDSDVVANIKKEIIINLYDTWSRLKNTSEGNIIERLFKGEKDIEYLPLLKEGSIYPKIGKSRRK